MCGRITLTVGVEDLRAAFGFAAPAGYRPRYNIAPSQAVLTVAEIEGERAFHLHRWGLVPFWAADTSIGNRMINARGETVREKPAFRASFARRRCLVVVDGFYEWQTAPGGKVPYRIRRADQEPFTLAGIWDRWTRAGEPIESCAIITTAANRLMEPIHDRMPSVIGPADRDAWLDPATPLDAVAALIRPHPGDELEAYEVSTLVNRPANDRPECIEPLLPDLLAP